MKALVALFGALSAFFMVLNAFGGIVSGIWIAVLGEWWAIGFGILIIAASTFVISIALLPGMGLAAGGIALGQKSTADMMLLMLMSSLYTVAVITVWCVGMLLVFLSRATHHSWIPLLIWSYGLATGPWTYMASKESQGGGGEGSVIAAFFAQLAYVVMVAVGLIFGGTVLSMAKVFGGVMLVGVLIQVVMVVSLVREPGYNTGRVV